MISLMYKYIQNPSMLPPPPPPPPGPYPGFINKGISPPPPPRLSPRPFAKTNMSIATNAKATTTTETINMTLKLTRKNV